MMSQLTGHFVEERRLDDASGGDKLVAVYVFKAYKDVNVILLFFSSCVL
jgi:hypothetical protein